MTAPRDTWRTEDVDALLAAVLRLRTVPEAEAFFRDLCTLGELHDMAQRWAVVRMLEAGMHYAEISRTTGASTATITRINSWLQHGEGGYRLLLDRIAEDSGSGDPATTAAARPATSEERP
jgi:TrpR-related protein YerC/YecD